MTWRAVGLACDGCQVPADTIGPAVPNKWVRVEAREQQGELETISIHHFCPGCAPLIRSYLKGRRE